MKSYADNFETLIEQEVVVSDASTLKLRLDKKKADDSLRLNIREYVTTVRYTGFSAKNGMTILLESEEQVDELKDNFISFLNKVKFKFHS